MKKKLASLVTVLMSVLGLAIFGLTLVPATASAADSYVVVENDPASCGAIVGYNHSGIAGSWQTTNIYPGRWATINNAGGYARVDVDLGGEGCDVDSWKKRASTGSFGPCYNNEDGASNPYNNAPASTIYRTYSHTGC